MGHFVSVLFSFPCPKWHPNHEAWRDGATLVLCPPAIPCSCSQPWACGETRQTARLHLGRRPRADRQVDGSWAEMRFKEVSRPTVEGGWQLGLSIGKQRGGQQFIHHTHGILRLAWSAQPDRSISHGFISGNPSISQVMVSL